MVVFLWNNITCKQFYNNIFNTIKLGKLVIKLVDLQKIKNKK